jgi:hypothetical protein
LVLPVVTIPSGARRLSTFTIFIPLVRKLSVYDGGSIKITNSSHKIGCDGLRESFESLAVRGRIVRWDGKYRLEAVLI